MMATNRLERTPWRRARMQAGTTAVEFALLAVIFLTFVFGIIELARLLFVFNTLQEVTRRAAAAAVNQYPTDTTLASIKRYAIFRDSDGELILAPPVTDKHIRLEYLRHDLEIIPRSSWPADAAANKQICMMNPRASNCIRFVQARVCDPANVDECIAPTAQMILPLVDLRVPLHRATTIATVETLGFVPGMRPPPPPCPCP